MRFLARVAWSCLAISLAVGCSSRETVVGPFAPGAGGDARQPSSSSGQGLVYVGTRIGKLYVLSYPSLQKLRSLQVTDVTGLCSDTKGNVFVTATPRLVGKGFTGILEYAHGGTQPINKITDDYRPYGCAVDPGTADLAVLNAGSIGGHDPNVAVYHHGKGTPQFWTNSSFYFYEFCGYDNSHNLFVDGVTEGNMPEFAELPKNGPLLSVTLNQAIAFPGSVQWDGSYVTVADAQAHVIYRFTFSGSAGTLQGSTTLTGWGSRPYAQTWISGSTILAPYGVGDARQVGIWDYPAGGNPIQTGSPLLRKGYLLYLTYSAAPAK